MLAELFLALNGFALVASDVDCVTAVLGLADGSLDEAASAAWLRSRLVAPKSLTRLCALD